MPKGRSFGRTCHHFPRPHSPNVPNYFFKNFCAVFEPHRGAVFTVDRCPQLPSGSPILPYTQPSMTELPPKKTYVTDPFPFTTGLVAQYKPFILKEVGKYSRRYGMRFPMVLLEALRIAERVAPRFDPKLGYDFTTFLRKHLLGLNRICQSHLSAIHGRPAFLILRDRRRPSYRARAQDALGGRIRWDDHKAALVELDQHQKNSLKLTEKVILDWMIEPDGRTLAQVAEKFEIPKATASKTRWRLLLKANNCTGQ